MRRGCCAALPCGAMGLSAVCDCSIPRLYSLFFYELCMLNSAMNTKISRAGSYVHFGPYLHRASLFEYGSNDSLRETVHMHKLVSVFCGSQCSKYNTGLAQEKNLL